MAPPPDPAGPAVPQQATLRPATAADAPAIAALWAPIIRDTVVTFHPQPRPAAEIAAMIATRQDAGQAFLVAVAGDALLGFASYSQFRAGPGYARTMEHTLNLSPAARGRGLGRQLLRALEAHATAAGHRSLIGAIAAANTGSLAFHRRLGFVEVGRIPEAGWKFGRFHDLVLMQRRLGGDNAAPPG